MFRTFFLSLLVCAAAFATLPVFAAVHTLPAANVDDDAIEAEVPPPCYATNCRRSTDSFKQRVPGALIHIPKFSIGSSQWVSSLSIVHSSTGWDDEEATLRLLT